MKDRQK